MDALMTSKWERLAGVWEREWADFRTAIAWRSAQLDHQPANGSERDRAERPLHCLRPGIMLQCTALAISFPQGIEQRRKMDSQRAEQCDVRRRGVGVFLGRALSHEQG